MDHRTRRPLTLARILPGLLALALATLLFMSCGRSPADLAGPYTARGGEMRLTLKDTGKGSLSTPDDDISFTWERRGDEVWLHTRAGGVVVCALESDGSLRADIPGVGKLRFTRR